MHASGTLQGGRHCRWFHISERIPAPRRILATVTLRPFYERDERLSLSTVHVASSAPLPLPLFFAA